MQIGEGLKYLGGGFIVYAAMAACSGGGAPNPGTAVFDSGPGSGGHDALGAHDAFDTRADNTVVDVVGPVPDAKAQDGSGGAGCGSCTVSGNIRVITADTDPAQLVGTITAVPADMTVNVANGPFVLTDARANAAGTLSDSALELWLSTNGSCSEDVNNRNRIATLTESTRTTTPSQSGVGVAIGGSRYQAIHGARILIPAGSSVCAASNSGAKLMWAGFRSY